MREADWDGPLGTAYRAALGRGRPAVRVSVSNWTTDEGDVDRTVAAFVRAQAGG